MDAQPGEKYVYGYNTDILGVVVEKVSGMTLADFFQKRITGPLGMVDTQFYLPPAQKARLAAVYAAKDGKIERAPDPKTGQGHYVDGPRVAFSGGAGLLSTARDYGRFLQMLLNGGEIDGVRLLSPKTVELMTVNHVGTLFAERGPNDAGIGFGLGFDVIEDLGRNGRYGSVGALRLGRRLPHELLGGPEGEAGRAPHDAAAAGRQLGPARKFRTLVYQSIVGPPTGVPAAAVAGGASASGLIDVGRRVPPRLTITTPARTRAEPASSRGRSGSSNSTAPTATATIGMR